MKSTASTAAGRPRKSPLRVGTMPRLARDLITDPGPLDRRSGRDNLSAADLRQIAVSEFTAWLSGKTNKQDRPFQEHTICVTQLAIPPKLCMISASRLGS
jgi:hypothetical protein